MTYNWVWIALTGWCRSFARHSWYLSWFSRKHPRSIFKDSDIFIRFLNFLLLIFIKSRWQTINWIALSNWLSENLYLLLVHSCWFGWIYVAIWKNAIKCWTCNTRFRLSTMIWIKFSKFYFLLNSWGLIVVFWTYWRVLGWQILVFSNIASFSIRRFKCHETHFWFIVY